MKTSSPEQTRNLYEHTADSYDEMMDNEIDLPLYADVLSRLATRVAGRPGAVVDTSCGSGHMLQRYRERYDPKRAIVGIDLSPRMVAIASERWGATGHATVGDMRHLPDVPSGTAAAIVSFFALHHLNPDDVPVALKEWHRVLHDNGQLVIATWEGSGPIDYGSATDVVALRYTQQEITRWVEASGFVVDRCVVESVDEMEMDAIYLEATKESP